MFLKLQKNIYKQVIPRQFLFWFFETISSQTQTTSKVKMRAFYVNCSPPILVPVDD